MPAIFNWPLDLQKHDGCRFWHTTREFQKIFFIGNALRQGAEISGSPGVRP